MNGFPNFLDDFVRGPIIAEGLLKEIDRVFPRGVAPAGEDVFLPVDVEEQADRFVVTANVPGVNKDRIDVTFDRNHLIITVSDEQKSEEANAERKFLRRERRFRSARRAIQLKGASADKVEAELKDGVLTVSVGKEESVQPKKVTIK